MMMAKANTADVVVAKDKPVKTGKPGKPAAQDKPNAFQRLMGYFRDVRAEMTRVVWPTRSEVLNSSVVVVTTLLFFILFIAATDFIVQQALIILAKVK